MEIIFIYIHTILCVGFILTLCLWAIFKILTVISTSKLQRYDIYKNIKREIRSRKFPRYSLKIIIISAGIFGAFATFGIILGIIVFFMLFITLGGTMYVDTGADPTFYYNLMDFAYAYLKVSAYVVFILYIAMYLLPIRGMYINILTRKQIQALDTSALPQPPANSEPTPRRRKKKIIITCGIIAAAILYVLIETPIGKMVFRSKTTFLEDVVTPSMNNSVTMTSNWYFFHNDRLYVYDDDGDELYSTNLSGGDWKVITSSEDLRYANIFMVYDEEMFYYTEYNRGVKKANLETGEITTVIDNEYLYLMPDTLDNGKVLVNYQNDYVNKSHAYFATLDLKTGELSNEKKVIFSSQQPYFYHMETGKIYYIDSYGDTNHIYEDDQIIYTYEDSKGRLHNDYDFVFVQDNYIFAVIANRVLKLDATTYEVIERKPINSSYILMSSVREAPARVLGIEEGPAMATTHPIFTIMDEYFSDASDTCGDVYKFNSETLSFEKIIEKNARGGFIQKYDNYYILQTDIETVVYDDDTGKYKIYDSANYSVEDGYIYMLTYKGDFYHQKSDDLKFKMKKILLEDIF